MSENGYLEKHKIVFECQKGCVMRCKDCERYKISKGGINSLEDMQKAVLNSILLIKQQGVNHIGKLYLYFFNLGEPSFNSNINIFLKDILLNDLQKIGIKIDIINPVITTILPKNNPCIKDFVYELMFIKNNIYKGNIDINFNIYSMNENIRNEHYNNMTMSLNDIYEMFEIIPKPKQRKYGLIFNGDKMTRDDILSIVEHMNNLSFIVKIEFYDKEKWKSNKYLFQKILNDAKFKCIIKYIHPSFKTI